MYTYDQSMRAVEWYNICIAIFPQNQDTLTSVEETI